MKEYVLMNQDYELIHFGHEITSLGDEYKIYSVNNENRNYLPVKLRIDTDKTALGLWVNARIAPTGRHHIEAILKAINLQNHFEALMYTHALSLNDTFWIKEVDEDVTFSEINLYDNKFDAALGWLAFTGLPSDISKTLGTPELTTVGCLPKYWERTESKIQMCKGGTEKYANAGCEPISEVVASMIGKIMDLDVIDYRLETRKVKDKKKLVSVSNLFTSKKYGLLTGQEALIRMIGEYKGLNVSDFIEWLLPSCERKFFDMCFFDWIVKNEDRHLSNWGFLVDNLTGEIVSFAPIWDTGMSLMWSSMETDFPDWYDNEYFFRSFGVKYDFILDSKYRDDYCHKCNQLLKVINSGKLLEQIEPLYKQSEKHYWKAPYVIEMLKRQCEKYLAHKPVMNKMKLF